MNVRPADEDGREPLVDGMLGHPIVEAVILMGRYSYVNNKYGGRSASLSEAAR